MFGLSPLEIVFLALLALFIFGPERLPKVIAEAVQMLRGLRRMARTAAADLSREMGTDVRLEDLNPRTFVRRHLLSEDDEDILRRPFDDLYRDLRRPLFDEEEAGSDGLGGYGRSGRGGSGGYESPQPAGSAPNPFPDPARSDRAKAYTSVDPNGVDGTVTATTESDGVAASSGSGPAGEVRAADEPAIVQPRPARMPTAGGPRRTVSRPQQVTDTEERDSLPRSYGADAT
jgi:sec-independent protein translocase protein TatB